MASKGQGPLVFFKKVRRAATKAKPYLKPAGVQGRRVMVVELRRGIATLSGRGSLNTRAVTAVAAKAVRIGAFSTLIAAQLKVPKGKTGRLRASLNARMRSSFLWTVGTNVRYARWVEEGTRGGRIIRPRRKKALSFHWANAPAGVRRHARRRSRGRSR